MVLAEVDNGVFAWDVGCGDDDELGPVDEEVVGDGGDAAAGDGGTDGGAVRHAGEGDVIYIQGAARDFSEALLADGRCTENGAGFRHTGYTISGIR